MSDAFHGAKLALFCAGDLIVMRRDDTPGIPWPGAVDFPGGGAEAGETPADCVLRELHEELSIEIPQQRIEWQRAYCAQGHVVWFLVARISPQERDQIQLGDEGQAWWIEPVSTFLGRDDAVVHLQNRLRDYLADASKTS
ncbi:MAG: NUDIX hydrolase [Pseudomonadota bacterium]